ncbi:hypothetical protein ABRT01_17490 [Lentibacillus sp. L22]|uniref:hypothetical protein n=1 Tax=Lentibacillus sp. L22 TaxID=3163028 RepID=UPI003465FCAE
MMTAEVEQALKKLNPKIKKSLYYTSPQNRQDLEQELNMKITECFYNDVFEQPPGFWEFAKRFD